ncbi:MAG: DUF1295 domain-containing protein [Gammaproteobacteria bacterium]|nr:DUF1295 domain-containing protein [Gammaproteobacteria bacterium]
MNFTEIGTFFTASPLGTTLLLCLGWAALIWVLSVVTREYSWIDRSWSVCPLIYCLMVAWDTGLQNPRVILMTVLVGLWSLRLTYNFARKGGYAPGGEDYRWKATQDKMNPVVFQLLNITFVAPGQMLIIWLFTSPIFQAWEAGSAPLGAFDLIVAALFLLFLVGETVADEQMWRFQQDKKKRLTRGESTDPPFLTTGLYRLSRHPNYLCDMALWCTFYFFGVAATGEWLHWTGLGFIALCLIFAGSIPLTESISASKYSGYREYQASTPVLVPIPWRIKQSSKT